MSWKDRMSYEECASYIDCPYCGGVMYADHQSMDVGVGVPYIFQTEGFGCEECGAMQFSPFFKGEECTDEENRYRYHRGEHHTCMRPDDLVFSLDKHDPKTYT